MYGDTTGPLAPGQSFGPRYLIIKPLGVGGMGAVYQAWDAELGEAVAIKVIRPEVMADPRAARDIERRFKRELQLARQVTHKNVIRIHDLGEIGGIKYITMSFVDGTDLATVLRREGPLDAPRALAITRALVSGLIAAHAAGVVHRDLKPANVMLGADGDAYLMDFGIARSIASPRPEAGSAPSGSPDALRHQLASIPAGATAAGVVLGTVPYMAPEQARGAEVDQRADIYALGLIIYDMLAGRRRHERASSAIAELEERILQAPPPLRAVRPATPEALSQVVARCLEPDPGKRYQTMRDLAADLARLDEQGVPLPIRRVVGLPLVAAVVAVLSAVSVGTWWYWSGLVPPAARDPVAVVIADLQNATGDAAFDRTLEPMLRRALEDASFISAYDRSRLGGLGVQAPEHLSESGAREIALKQGLGVVVSGALEPRGNGYRLSIRAIQTVSGETITDGSVNAAGKDQVLAAATRLVTRVRNALGDDLPESAQLHAMRSVSASSLEVISHYAAALEAQTRGRFEDARQSYLRAVELDPTFAVGYQGLAAVSRNLDLTEEADRYIKEALRHLDGLTDREKFGTRGLYYRMTADYQQCVREYSELLVRYPADVVAYNQRAICLKNLRRMREATADMRQAVRILPNHVVLRTNLALFANFSGEFEAAGEQVQAIPQPLRTSLAALAASQVARGLMRDATATYERLAPMDGRSASVAASGVGDMLMYEGRFTEAVQALERGAAADLAAKSPDRAAMKFAAIGYAHLMAGRPQLAVAAAERARRSSTSLAARFPAARVFAEAGALDTAKTLAAELSAPGTSEESRAHGAIIEGLIALQSGRASDAVTLLTDANARLDTWVGHFDLGRAYLDTGAFVQADSEFDRCIARRGEALALMDDEEPTYGYFPPVYYYLGRAREGVGSARFADSYREYIRIRGASSEDPLLTDARRRAGS